MNCKLCGEQKTLVKKSHIISEFLFESLYDADRKLREFEPFSISKGKGRIKRPSSGKYEGNILCEICENRISSFETYASKVFDFSTGKSKDKSVFQIDTKEWIAIKGLNYDRFKCFLLSLFWRASISSLNEFAGTNLGPHEEEIRRLILGGFAGKTMDYPTYIYLHNGFNGNNLQFISPPSVHKTQTGHLVYNLPILSSIISLYVNSRNHPYPYGMKETVLNSQGEIKIVKLTKELSTQILNKHLKLNL
ncbi:hypothetical protein [Jiulongibacter sp. NS-SX5]|uniref:hypothetical protein n=1 Tax=Jiulongibacter sp. NS-SX5 TaxID=3463854 RepID=UPI0040598D15